MAVATFYQAFKLKSRIWRTMLKRNGVTGIGVGYADPNRPAKGAAIVVYTLRNLSAVTQTKLQAVTHNISQASAVPIRILGVGSFKGKRRLLPKRTHAKDGAPCPVRSV